MPNFDVVRISRLIFTSSMCTNSDGQFFIINVDKILLKRNPSCLYHTLIEKDVSALICTHRGRNIIKTLTT